MFSTCIWVVKIKINTNLATRKQIESNGDSSHLYINYNIWVGGGVISAKMTNQMIWGEISCDFM